jgi:cobalt-zinc-cadmium efflux system membrane fusion protein
MSEKQVTGDKKRTLPRIILVVLTILATALVGWRLWTPSQKAQPIGASAHDNAESPIQPSNHVQLSAEAIARGEIEISEAITQTIRQSLDVAGRLALNEDAAVRVGTIVTGRVTRVLAMVGDVVKEGQALVYIHSHELVDARAAEAKARVMVTEKEKALAYAKAELERAERLLEAKAIAKREHALAAANVNATAAELEHAKAELTRAAEFLEHLSVPHDSHEDIVAYSPIAGIVLKRNVSVGAVVSEATDLMMVGNLSTLWAIAEVPERQAAIVRMGQPVEIELQAFTGAKFSGRVVHIGDSLDPETRTVQVRCLVRNPRGLLRPEMFATIKLNNGATQPALTVPRSALFEMENEKVVFIALGAQGSGLFEKRTVQTGREQGEWIEITGGLKPGERIVTRGGFFIKSEFLKGSLAEE